MSATHGAVAAIIDNHADCCGEIAARLQRRGWPLAVCAGDALCPAGGLQAWVTESTPVGDDMARATASRYFSFEDHCPFDHRARRVAAAAQKRRAPHDRPSHHTSPYFWKGD